jgi:ubiquinone/menaquinone biosynthesis C-methylase UbiE
MGIMLMPDPDKALREIYRTLKPGGYCGLTTPQAVVHRDIAERVIERLRGPEGTYDRPPTLFKADEFLESTQLAGRVESVGFEDVNVRVETIWAVWKGEEGRKIAVGNFANIYKNFIEFREGEEEKWESLWEEQCLEDLGTEDGGLKMGQPVNILWGKKPTN